MKYWIRTTGLPQRQSHGKRGYTQWDLHTHTPNGTYTHTPIQSWGTLCEIGEVKYLEWNLLAYSSDFTQECQKSISHKLSKFYQVKFLVELPDYINDYTLDKYLIQVIIMDCNTNLQSLLLGKVLVFNVCSFPRFRERSWWRRCFRSCSGSRGWWGSCWSSSDHWLSRQPSTWSGYRSSSKLGRSQEHTGAFQLCESACSVLLRLGQEVDEAQAEIWAHMKSIWDKNVTKQRFETTIQLEVAVHTNGGRNLRQQLTQVEAEIWLN